MSYKTKKTVPTDGQEDVLLSEDEEYSLSTKLSHLTQSRLQKFNLSSPAITNSPSSALAFDLLIKKNPFEKDFKFKQGSKKSSSEVSPHSTEPNSKPGYNFSKAVKQHAENEIVGVRAIQSADISFDGSPRCSESGISEIHGRDKRANSVDVRDPTSFRKGILKLGTRSRFFKDTESRDPSPHKLSKSTKSSSFRLPKKDDKTKPAPMKGSASPFKKSRTLIKNKFSNS